MLRFGSVRTTRTHLAPAAAGCAQRMDPACPSPPKAPVSTFHSPSRPRGFGSDSSGLQRSKNKNKKLSQVPRFCPMNASTMTPSAATAAFHSLSSRNTRSLYGLTRTGTVRSRFSSSARRDALLSDHPRGEPRRGVDTRGGGGASRRGGGDSPGPLHLNRHQKRHIKGKVPILWSGFLNNHWNLWWNNQKSNN